MNKKYIFGERLTEENFEALRKLAQKLSYKEFGKTTGFGHGIYTRLRRFSKLKDYKNYIADNRRKSTEKSGPKVTLKDIYEKLLGIEKKLA